MSASRAAGMVRGMVDWGQVDSVFLDMDGTLLDLYFDNHFWQEHVPMRYAQKRALSVATARAELAARYRSHAGTLEWYCVDFWSRELDLDIVALKQEVAHLIAVHPDVRDFLEAVRQSGRRVVLVTNAHGKSLALKMRHTGLEPYFDALVTSHQVGLPKEDAAFWAELSKIEPYAPARTLMVDDSLPVLRAARSAGLGQLLAVKYPDSRQPLKDSEEFAALGSFRELLPLA